MELNKKTIHMKHQKGRVEQIVTIDDDFNVPDSKPDIVKKIKENADIVIEKVRPMEERVSVGGELRYRLLYATEDGCACMSGAALFDESVAMGGVTPQDVVKCVCELEDVTVTVINSRKISVKAVITLEITAECIYDKEAVGELELENLQCIKKKINVMQLASSKKDIFRIRESMNLPGDRPNVEELIWYELEPQSIDIRACDGELSIKGELCVFCIYSGEGDGNSMNFFDDILPFAGKIDVSGCSEEMLPDVCITVSEKSLIARPDANAELRILDAEVILDLDIKGYSEQEYEVLADAYSPSYDLRLVNEPVEYESFLMKNSAKCRMEERFSMPQGGIMQIVGSSGRTNIEDIITDGSSVTVEGAVTVEIIYIKPDDNDKLGYVRYELPFSEQSDIAGLDGSCTCTGKAGPLQVSTLLTGGGEVNIKCNAIIDLMAVKSHSDNLICDVTAAPPDYGRIKNLPGIVGYITRPGDTLWNIAKEYCTTIKDIMDTNGLASEEIKPGMKLIIIKKC